MVGRILIRWIVSLLLFPGHAVLSQGELHIDCYGVDDGLSHARVNAVLQDGDGYMWFATDRGLNRFDGYRFHAFHGGDRHSQLISTAVHHLALDGKGRVWAATANALYGYDADRAVFERFPLPYDGRASDNPPVIRGFLADSAGGLLVVVPATGLLHFDPDRGRYVQRVLRAPDGTPPLPPLGGPVAREPGGRLWLGAGYTLLAVDSSARVMRRETLPPDAGTITALHGGHDRTLWIGTTGGYTVLRGSAPPAPVTVLPRGRGAADNAPLPLVSTFMEVGRRMWIGTRGSGVYVLDRGAEAPTPFLPCNCIKETGGLSSSWVNAFGRSRTGTFWVATDEGVGKFTLRRPLFAAHRTDHLASDSACGGEIRYLMEDADSTVLISTWEGGLCRMSGDGAIRREPLPPALAGYRFGPLLRTRDGALWMGVDRPGGVVRYDPASGRVDRIVYQPGHPASLSDRQVSALVEDARGDIWIGTVEGGLNRYRIDDGRVTVYRAGDSATEGLVDDRVHALGLDRHDRLWVVTAQAVHRMESNRRTIHRYRLPGVPAGWPPATAYSVAQGGDGTVWVGTSLGLGRIAPDALDGNAVEPVTVLHGMVGRTVLGVLCDAHGVVWMLTNKGVASLIPATGVVRNYSDDDGCVMVGKEFREGARPYLRTGNGDLLFGGIDGITRHRLRDRDNMIIPPPPMVITGLAVDGDSLIAPEAGARLRREALRIPSDHRRIAVEFAALDYTRSLDNEYVYRLAGYDSDWIYGGTRRVARYGPLPPGEYTFEVRGAGHDEVWNNVGAALALRVAPPLWQQGWIRIVALAVLIGLVVLGHFARVISLKRTQSAQERFSRQLLESQEEERKRIAAELHDGLGQNLLLINYQVGQQGDAAAGDGDRATRPLAAMVREALDEVRSIAYDLHPHHLDRLGLKAALESAVTRAAGASGVDLVAMVDDIDDLFTDQNRIHFFRIIQEAVSNVCRHAGATRGIVHVERGRDAVRVSIRDNGRGFIVADSAGLGLTNMRERSRLLKGRFDIRSRPGEGTTVSLRIALADLNDIANGRKGHGPRTSDHSADRR